jgi:hypothetical protein
VDVVLVRQCVAEPENRFFLAEAAETGAETAENYDRALEEIVFQKSVV